MMVVFEKGEALRHIGHLDLMRTMQRALRRSGLPIAYSKGFSPHVQGSFASPLSVGIVGLREVMDVPLAEAVEEAIFAEKLNLALPRCMHVKHTRLLEDEFPTLMALVAASRYTLHLEDSHATQAVLVQLPAFLALDSYSALRKTKSGEAMCNIRPFVLEAEAVRNTQGPCLRAVLGATPTGTLKPSLWLRCLCEMARGGEISFLAVREEVLCRGKDGQLVPMEEYVHG